MFLAKKRKIKADILLVSWPPASASQEWHELNNTIFIKHSFFRYLIFQLQKSQPTLSEFCLVYDRRYLDPI